MDERLKISKSLIKKDISWYNQYGRFYGKIKSKELNFEYDNSSYLVYNNRFLFAVLLLKSTKKMYRLLLLRPTIEYVPIRRPQNINAEEMETLMGYLKMMGSKFSYVKLD